MATLKYIEQRKALAMEAHAAELAVVNRKLDQILEILTAGDLIVSVDGEPQKTWVEQTFTPADLTPAPDGEPEDSQPPADPAPDPVPEGQATEPDGDGEKAEAPSETPESAGSPETK